MSERNCSVLFGQMMDLENGAYDTMEFGYLLNINYQEEHKYFVISLSDIVMCGPTILQWRLIIGLRKSHNSNNLLIT